MATVTVESAHATTVTLTYNSNANAALAQYVANAIQAGITGSTLLAGSSQFGTPPPIASGKMGEWVETTPSPTTLTTRYDYVVASSTSTANVTAPNDPNVQIIAGSGNLTLNTGLGSGSLIAGDGNNAIITPASSSGHWSFILGDGNNTVKALGTGADTISLGAGNNVVTTNGAATITGAGTTVINGSSIGGSLTFLGTGGGATVFGGAGSDTLSGRNGPDYFQGGTGGNNSIVAGAGAATLFGGGSGDQLFANGKGAQILRAGTGNETLTGSSVGGGSDTFVASQGTTAVLVTPLDSNLFEFIHGSAGGTLTAYGLTSIEQLDIHLSGYASNSLGGVASQNNSGGNLNITLTDGTQITFQNLSQPLTNSNFS
jgi:Ca2+-binding RTX toxin-like protein